MRPIEKWIWLPKSDFPDRQETRYSEHVKTRRIDNYTVAAFRRKYCFDKPIREVSLRFSGDTAFALYCNQKHIATGPALPGGDFLELYTDEPLPQHYATEVTLTAEEFSSLESGTLEFYAQVRMMPARCFDFSQGHGGFFLTAHVWFADGTKKVVHTDKSWSAQHLSAYTLPGCYDNSAEEAKSVPAEEIVNIWHCQTAPIPPCVETILTPQEGSEIVVPAGQKVETVLNFDRIYAAYLMVSAKTKARLEVTTFCREIKENGTVMKCTFVRDGNYRGLELHSAGNLRVEAENFGDEDAVLSLNLIAAHYPVEYCAVTTTSDEELNQVLDVCTHTLKYCRQSMHLDSPRHCELLACTGDYYVESMMTAFTFGDMRLAAFDLRRTAELLRYRDGRMFHTTYSLIWVQMLWDVYCLTGEKQLLSDCEDALDFLLDRFSTYLGDNGIIETPPDYMFIDWLVPDGINMHHPPKALGQTCMNMFYYGALKTALKIYAVLGEDAMADLRKAQMDALHDAVEHELYDAQRQMFFEGLNTPTEEKRIGHWMPQNVEKRYYRKHANILAAYFGFFEQEKCAALLKRILDDDTLGEVQPYFMHFMLDAVYRNGLREKYTRKIVELWKEPVRECSKGLAEGFYKPDKNYGFDHSHAWGGTPAYAIPKALSGIEILEPGYKKIRLNPSLMGLETADVQIPTPYGMITLSMREGEENVISVPEEIVLETE
ncbi:MAG: hypothetical protein E7335_01220 [Clostridiales bacterium]|nr:hypothetical protein [Clostridiales bacterium]